MPTINEIIDRQNRRPGDIIADLKNKTIDIPAWGTLEKEYNPRKHPVYTDRDYRDKVRRGKVERMTRITYSIQKQAVKRMKELMFTISVKRRYTATTDSQQAAASQMMGGKQEPIDDNAGRNVLRYGKDDKAGYATWAQATDALKLHTEELRRNIHTTLQLPDMSMEQMKATPMSGEARKMLFIDCQMKVTDEKGDWLESFDREINVVRAFCKAMYPELAADFDTLVVESVVMPFQINDRSQQIKDMSDGTGGKAIISRRTAIRELDLVPEEEIESEEQRIEADETAAGDIFANEPTA